ncbi:MAG: amidohydrolase [Acidimicrobiia bacterium]|nr:amidohydrolase [Acidimicrobiia bacterium]
MSDLAELYEQASERVESRGADLVELSHRIHAHPELALEERQAAQWLADVLERGGFEVERGSFDLETSFLATAGDSGPHVVLCAEYAALPGIGQACGHNLIGTAAVGAGLALAPLAAENGFRVSVLGTPAEEDVGGKRILVARGAFEGVDACLMVHPAPLDIRQTPMLALRDLRITVRGQAGHASLQSGGVRNALSALVDVHTHLSALDLGPYERCAGVILEGGRAPNVVPDTAVSYWFVRARTEEELEQLLGIVRTEVEARVAAHGCSVEFDSRFGTREMKTNVTLAAVYERHAEALGRDFVPQGLIGAESAASTDQGDVSQVVPSIHPMIGIDSGAVLPHEAAFADAAVSEAADRAVLDGAKALAHTALDTALADGVLEAARAEFESTDSTGAEMPGGD